MSRARAAALLRGAPILVPCLAVLPLLAWWAADGAGFAVGAWSPGALLVLGLLAIALVVVPNRWGDVPRSVALAAGLLGAFTAWSYASVGWADDPGAALEGANRTLLYLALFCLFALWRQRTLGAAVLVGGWVLAVVAVAGVTAVRLATDADPAGFFAEDRLATPVGYPNAAAATFALALWPAIVLAASRRVHPLVRGTCAGGAVLLADLALLAQSRGALLAIPLTGLVCLALVPGRTRIALAALAVGAGVAASAPAALDVADALTGEGDAAAAIGSAGGAMLLAAIVLVALVTGLAARERTRPARPPRVLGKRGLLAAAALAVVLVPAAAVVVDPGKRLDRTWTSFKGGYDENDATAASRLVGGLGSNRYDFYRVALDEFRSAPLVGHGGDNFQQSYLARGRSTETPRYPHSFELRTLVQTGVVGSLLLLGALLSAAWAAFRGLRARPEERSGADAGLRAAAGGAALVGAAYVFVHGSADWFWETAGLSAPAFALLGLAAGLAPRGTRAPLVRAGTPAGLAGTAALLLAGVLAVAGPWLADRETTRAAEAFTSRPLEAYDRLDRAARLNPLSDRPALLAGSIAVRYGDLPRADAAFGDALARVPDGQYATLQRGAVASARGDRATAERLLSRAVALAPRDLTAREALAVVRDGGRVDLANLSRRILGQAQELG